MSEEEDLKYLQTEYEENIITELIKKVKDLQNQLQQKENIIKEVKEYLNKHEIEGVYLDCKLYEIKVYKDILEILDKVD